MGITGLIPFLENASKRANISEFSGCTVAIDSYCWLHKGAFACAEKLVRGEETNMHINYCMKYVNMLLLRNIKPILVFDGRHLPAKAMTEAKRRESRKEAKKRAAELLTLGKIEEARKLMKRGVDITHSMALALIKECRKMNVDCVVAPYEADAQLAYLNLNNIAQVVITEDSDLLLFGCTKVFFKMDLEGQGTLVEAAKLPLAMKCSIEQYSFDKFRRMCIMSGCDYLASLPGIGLAKAKNFVLATQDPNFANALRKLPSFYNRCSLTVTDEYRENFLKAEATFKHQYVYDPLHRAMVRLTEPDDEDIEKALCVNAGELLEPDIAFQLALGNLDPFTLNRMDDWHPDHRSYDNENIKTDSWKQKGVSNYPSIWSPDYRKYLDDSCPWQKKVNKPEPIIAVPKTRPRPKVVNLVSKYVPESQDQSLSIEALSKMYSIEPPNKRQKVDCDNSRSTVLTDDEILKEVSQKERSPILENKQRSFKKLMNNAPVKRLSKFPTTVLDDNIVESKFFDNNRDSGISIKDSQEIETPEPSRNPFKVIPTTEEDIKIDSQCYEIPDSQSESSQKENLIENSLVKPPRSPILDPSPRNPFRTITKSPTFDVNTEDSVIENTCSFDDIGNKPLLGKSPVKSLHIYAKQPLKMSSSQPSKSGAKVNGSKKSPLKRTVSLPTNQPTLLSKFGFQKKPVLRKS